MFTFTGSEGLTDMPLRMLAGSVALLIVMSLAKRIYHAFFTPLRRVPGPWICKLTSLPDAYQAFVEARRSEWIHELHARYGPIVQIAPNLVTVASTDNVKDIYGGKMLKLSSAYNPKRIDGIPHSLTFTNPSESKARRKIILPLFQRQNLLDFLPEIQHLTSTLIRQIDHEQASEGSVDVFRWLRLIAFDIIGKVGYGEDMGMTKAGKTNALVEWMADAFIGVVAREVIPGFAILDRLRLVPVINRSVDAGRRFANYGSAILDNIQSAGELTDHGGAPNLLKALHRASLSDPSITRRHITGEAGAVLIAGSDTTSTAMTFALWELARNQDLQAEVRAELNGAAGSDQSDIKTLESLPLFNCVLKEVLRRWPTLPGPLERTVPPGGILLHGTYLPEGTGIAMQAYTVHRDERIFPQPDKFMPSRWLHETADMRAALLTFSVGPRQCPGMNLAWMEMRLILGILLNRYRFSLAKTTTDDSMAPEEHFFVVPK